MDTTLAQLVHLGGADPALYQDIAENLRLRAERAARLQILRAIGLHIQAAVEQTIRGSGLAVTLIDHGFDLEVTAPDDLGICLTVGSYLVEIKAATVGDVAMTPLQAKTASENPEKYALCVVDLRDVSSGGCESVGVLERARLVPDIGYLIAGTYGHVEKAKLEVVGLRNDSALRYVVSVNVWSGGVPLSQWLSNITTGHGLGRN